MTRTAPCRDPSPEACRPLTDPWRRELLSRAIEATFPLAAIEAMIDRLERPA